jgi:hypothetical protein
VHGFDSAVSHVERIELRDVDNDEEGSRSQDNLEKGSYMRSDEFVKVDFGVAFIFPSRWNRDGMT